MSAALSPGQAFEVRNAADFFGAPVLQETYAGGTITLPMTGLTVAAPIGGTAPPPTGPKFNAFILLPLTAAPTCTYALGATTVSAAAAGGTGNVSVTAGAACSWTATSNAAWLTISSGASGSGNGTVGYSVAANPNCTGRSGSLTVAGQTFTVTQAAGSGTSSISPTGATTSAGSGGGTIAVTTLRVRLVGLENASWITVTGSGTGNGTATYTIASNSGCARAGTLTVAGHTFTVNQAAGASCSRQRPPVLSHHPLPRRGYTESQWTPGRTRTLRRRETRHSGHLPDVRNPGRGDVDRRQHHGRFRPRPPGTSMRIPATSHRLPRPSSASGRERRASHPRCSCSRRTGLERSVSRTSPRGI